MNLRPDDPFWRVSGWRTGRQDSLFIFCMLIRVKTFPGFAKEEVVETHKNSFRVFVREEARNGMATEAVRRALSKYFGILPREVVLKRGGKERNKFFEVPEKRD